MFNNQRVRGAWWTCAATAVLLAAGCVSAASEESGGSSPASDGSSGAGDSSAPPASDSPLPSPGGVTTTGVEENVVVQVGEENGGGGSSSGVEPLEPLSRVVTGEVGVSEEGLERLRRVLGEDKYAAVLENAESLGALESYYPELVAADSGVLLGRLAGENGFLTEEGLSKLAERRSGEDLAREAYAYSEEVLAEYANESEAQMARPLDIDVSDFEGRFVDEYSDEDVKAYAFYERADAERDNRVWERLWEENDRSTPVGAFCWAVLRVRHIESSTDTEIRDGFRPWESRNLRVWHLEREAEERGIELEWETPPLDADRVFRRVLLEATAPEIRSVVFASGLPSVLRPAAEALYNFYDELLALPVRRIRPTLEELSGYRRLRDLTEEEITQIWPERLEIDYREEDKEKYRNAMDVLLGDEVREILNAECKERFPELESACPPWEVPETAEMLSIWCGGDGMLGMFEDIEENIKEEIEDILEGIDGPIESCPLFYAREASYEERQSECTVNEETEEALERVGELLERSEELKRAEFVDGVVSAEGVERLKRVLGEEKYADVVDGAERWDVPELLGRLAGENGLLTEEGLGKLAERRSGWDLAQAGYSYGYSEEDLAEYANESEERMAGPRDTEVYTEVINYYDGRFAEEYSDYDVKGFAFGVRDQAEYDNRLWEDHDLSTPVGAFCWAVLRVEHIESRTDTGIGNGFRPWQSRNLRVWHLEREAEERGLELEWETPPVDANRVFRRVLLEVTAPEIRSVVFDLGLPLVLRPAAELLYSVYDELLALPVRRIRPTVEELSGYRRLQDLTEEEIAQIWPEELEIDFREEDETKYRNAFPVLGRICRNDR